MVPPHPGPGTIRMPAPVSRRVCLLLPLLLAACAAEEPPPVAYAPLDYSYLPPLRLNVATIAIEQHFVASDLPPSVSQYDPVSPTAALRRMARERLKAFGSTGRAVFVIDDASLVRNGDAITGTFTVRLEIYTSAGTRAGFAEATVSRQRVGKVTNLAETLYLLTRTLMDRMNVEFEYQIRRSLGDWLVAPAAPAAAVQAAPLAPTGAMSGAAPAGDAARGPAGADAAGAGRPAGVAAALSGKQPGPLSAAAAPAGRPAVDEIAQGAVLPSPCGRGRGRGARTPPPAPPARGGEVSVQVIASAERARARRTNFWILPVEVFGSSRNTMRFGTLKPRQMLAAEGAQRVFGHLRAGLQLDEGAGRLAPFLVRLRHHRRAHHRGMAIQRLLDFQGRNVLAARDDDVLGTVADLDVAVGLHHREIAGVEPAAGERGRGRGRVAEIALHGDVAAEHDLAHRLPVGRHRLHRVGIEHGHRLLHRHAHALPAVAFGAAIERQRRPVRAAWGRRRRGRRSRSGHRHG